jgi:hypothetical protein
MMKTQHNGGWMVSTFAIVIVLIMSVTILAISTRVILSLNRGIDSYSERQAYWNAHSAVSVWESTLQFEATTTYNSVNGWDTGEIIIDSTGMKGIGKTGSDSNIVWIVELDEREEQGGGADPNTVFTFTNCGQEGRTGPSQDQCNLEYGEGVVTVTVDNGIQEWTVPETGAYTIEVWGAQGGPRKGYDNDNINRGGTGAILSGDFSLTEDLVLKIIVGQRGRESGGGGGTFVATSENIPLIVAGGGAAWCTCSEGTDDADAVLTEGDGVGGGTGCGSGGGGFYGNGTTSLQGYGTGGLAFVNGGTGGDGDFFQNIYISEGGFGSGGGASNCCIGGGGGYTGGKGAAACGAKGGHSYFNPEGSSRTDIGTDNTGHGKVIITFIE